MIGKIRSIYRAVDEDCKSVGMKWGAPLVATLLMSALAMNILFIANAIITRLL